MVDIALETREQAAILAVLDHFGQDFEARGGETAAGQREGAHLPRRQGRLRGGRHARAPRRCSPTSTGSRASTRRRSTSAASSRRARATSRRRGESLCEIVEQVDQNRFTFFIDGRYYGIKDLAYLALGRISHEQEKYDDAYYFYFRVPEDSERLPDALFEASWSMFQAGEYEAANAFLEEFDRSFGKTPLAPDVLLLHAMIDLKSCRFDDVRATLDKLVKTYAPLQAEGRGAAQGSRQARRLLPPPAQQAIDRDAARSDHRAAQDRPAVLQVLRRHRRARPRGWAAPRRGRGVGRADRAREGRPRRFEASEAVRLVNDVEALRPLAAGDPEMENRVADLADQARRAARLVNVRADPYAKEAAADAGAGRRDARKLRAQLVAATSAIAEPGAASISTRGCARCCARRA